MAVALTKEGQRSTANGHRFTYLDPHRRMVAGFFPSAYMTVNAGADEPFVHRRTEQEMIYAQAGIPAIGVAEIIPESIDLFFRVKPADGVCPALCNQVPESGPGFRAEQRV